MLLSSSSNTVHTSGNKMFKLTMRIESDSGETLDMARVYKDYEQGITECNVVCQFEDFLRTSNMVCISSVGLALPIHFAEVTLKDAYRPTAE